jgi:hypothetical protein
MKLFGAQRDPNTPAEGLLQARWFRGLLTFCTVLIVIAGCTEIYRRAANYGTKVVEATPVNAEIVIKSPPAWLHRDILMMLHDEAYNFARRDQATYDRVRNILDNDVLREIADLYTGVEKVDGTVVRRQSQGYNAWIKRITAVRRNVAKDKSRQTIEIDAEWRAPAAWVRVPSAEGEPRLCLVDEEGVRLPGDYQAGDRSRSSLLVLTGIELPVVEGKGRVPQPGERWTAGTTGKVGDDFVSGMKLVKMLQNEAFVAQIDAVDMTNYKGRIDNRSPWILLQTIYKTDAGTPRVIHWGRPAGEESVYEVKAVAKLRVLNEIYLRFNRIDAGRDYVDIRTELIRLPKLASQIDPPTPPARG